jgi:tRNA A37 threonylcarbamoyladenosine synthetase subunit TsaC/SUA5/YrdC
VTELVRGAGGRRRAAAVLAAGGAVALPGDGGYLAAGRAGGGADATARGASPDRDGPPEGDVVILIGRRDQVRELDLTWNPPARLLTDRMWPGPLVVMVDDADGEPVSVGMPRHRAVRALCRTVGPLLVWPLVGEAGPVHDAAGASELGAGAGFRLALVLDGGRCVGPPPTLVDGRVDPPVVRRVGALPETFVQGALLMAGRRRRWPARS